MEATIWDNGEGLEITVCSGAAAEQYAQAIAHIRIRNFRDFPYLYISTPEQETEYLARQFPCKDARFAFLKDSGQVQGFSIYLPLSDESEELQGPIEEKGLLPASYMYWAEAILNPAYRGRKLFPVFMRAVEEHAATLSLCAIAAICVCRTPEHPLWPKGYRPFEGFMSLVGFTPIKGCTVSYTWPTVPDGNMEDHTLQFWEKPIFPLQG